MFTPLMNELNKWPDHDGLAIFWWRDDDARKPTEALKQLLAISDQHRVPLSLAVIPEGVGIGLAEQVLENEFVCVMQHGFGHHNHAPRDQRKMELGWHRPGSEIMSQVAEGVERMQRVFGERFLPVMVPPWNRIDQRVVARLADVGLQGLSTLGPRKSAHPAPGIQQVNVHVDIMNWKEGRCFAGASVCVEQIVTHLRAKREGRADWHEATGIMSHHLVHDDGCWRFLNQLFEFLSAHPSARVDGAGTIFSPLNASFNTDITGDGHSE